MTRLPPGFGASQLAWLQEAIAVGRLAVAFVRQVGNETIVVAVGPLIAAAVRHLSSRHRRSKRWELTSPPVCESRTVASMGCLAPEELL